jgi:enoyl-CoA hydratase/carnithine racemase
VLKTARDLARKIAGKGALATRAALEAVTRGLDQPLDEGLALEARRFGEVAVSEDAREGAAAFLQKRQPVFKDR